MIEHGEVIGRRSTQALCGRVVDDAPGDRSGPWSRAACPYFGPRIEQEASTRIGLKLDLQRVLRVHRTASGDEALDKLSRPAARAAARRATTPCTPVRAPARRTMRAKLLAAAGLLGDGDATPRPRDAEATWRDYLTDHLARGAVRALTSIRWTSPALTRVNLGRLAAEPTPIILITHPRRRRRRRSPSPGRQAPSPGGCTARRAGRARRCPETVHTTDTQPQSLPAPRGRVGSLRAKVVSLGKASDECREHGVAQAQDIGARPPSRT